MNALKTKIQTHKILFIAIAIAILMAIGIGAFITTNALAYNGKYASFNLQIRSKDSRVNASDFAGSKVYFLSTDQESGNSGTYQIIYEGTFNQNGYVEFRGVAVGEKAYVPDEFCPVVYGGYATKTINEKRVEWSIKTTPVSENTALTRTSSGKPHTLYVDVEKCEHYNIKVNNGYCKFRCTDSSMESKTMWGKNIPAPKGSKIQALKDDRTPNKAHIYVGIEDKVVYKYEIVASGYESFSISKYNDQTILDENKKDIKFESKVPLQDNELKYYPVYAGSAKQHNFKFYTKDNNNKFVQLDENITMQGLKNYIGKLYVEESDEPCIAVRSLRGTSISYNSVYGKGGVGAKTVNKDWEKQNLLNDGTEILETVERLVDQNGNIENTPTVNGLKLEDIWDVYYDAGFGTYCGFLTCVALDEDDARFWYTGDVKGGKWGKRNRTYGTLQESVCVSRVF